MKWRSESGKLQDHRIPAKLKGKVYKMTIRLAMLYGTGYWDVKK